MEWQIHRDGFYYLDLDKHTFELGEMYEGKWLLKHWGQGARSSTWHDVCSADEGKALAERLATE